MNLVTAILLCVLILVVPGCRTLDETRRDEGASSGYGAIGLPPAGDPPDIYAYFNTNGTVEQDEVDRFYKALTNYHLYLQGYISFIGSQYHIDAYEQSKMCEDAKNRAIQIQTLPEPPDISGVPEAQVVDELINYIGVLRAIQLDTNKRINRRSLEIMRHCSK